MNVAIYPEDCSEQVLDGLTHAGVSVVAVAELAADDEAIADADILVVELDPQPMRRIREIGRVVETIGLPVLVVIRPEQLALIDDTTDHSDFVVAPVDPVEFRIRLRRLAGSESTDEVLRFKDLELNPLNYQAKLSDAPLDLTYMEYELLHFLMRNPVRVWSREQLLSKVWGYEYYGGARTVDVHVRRLRSKLGEERASWITTVRSVGYRFG